MLPWDAKRDGKKYCAGFVAIVLVSRLTVASSNPYKKDKTYVPEPALTIEVSVYRWFHGENKIFTKSTPKFLKRLDSPQDVKRASEIDTDVINSLHLPVNKLAHRQAWTKTKQVRETLDVSVRRFPFFYCQRRFLWSAHTVGIAMICLIVHWRDQYWLQMRWFL